MTLYSDDKPTGALALSDGTIFYGHGFGYEGVAVGEVCFNTAITGYQEILTDPSYASQLVTFTFPHVGNVGTNDEDVESSTVMAEKAARGCIVRTPVTAPANYRAQNHFASWLKERGIVGLSGVDTRALTRYIRQRGMPKGAMIHRPDGELEIEHLQEQAKSWAGLEGADLAASVSARESFESQEGIWDWPHGYRAETSERHARIVAIDFGAKKYILRLLAKSGFEVKVVPASSTADEILALQPDGIFLSNGPGDPAATGTYAIGEVQRLIQSGLPIFGICLGHQLLALALGAKTSKMHQGHHGANHPVKDLETGKVEIVSMNHGFTVDQNTLPPDVVETHISLFDGTNCGLRVKDKPIFCVQYHPEASPGPQDSYYLFERFKDAVVAVKAIRHA